MKLNFGSAHDKIDGFKNVDALDWDGNTDIICDMTYIPYPFDDESVDEIRSVETLEHIGIYHTENVLNEWFRILKDGGKIHIQVPDCGSMMKMYANNKVCDCVPHKPKSPEHIKAKKNCFNCNGKGKVNTTRWIYAFTGAQKHPYDSHLNIFTEELLHQYLMKAGFNKIKFKKDPYKWKLKVNAIKCIKEKY